MHRHAQQPFFSVSSATRVASLGHCGRRGRRHQTWVVRSMSQHVKQVKNSVPQTWTKHDKQNMNNSAHANMVNDNSTWSMTNMRSADVFQSACVHNLLLLSQWQVETPFGAKTPVQVNRCNKIHSPAQSQPGSVPTRLSTPLRWLSHFHHSKCTILPYRGHLRLQAIQKVSSSSAWSLSATTVSKGGSRHHGAKPTPELQHQTKIHKLHKTTSKIESTQQNPQNPQNKIKNRNHKSTQQNPQNPQNKIKNRIHKSTKQNPPKTIKNKIHKSTKQNPQNPNNTSNQIFTKWPWKVWPCGRSGCAPWPLSRRTTGPSGASHSCHSWTSGRWSPWRWSWTSWKTSSKNEWQKMTAVKSVSSKMNDRSQIRQWQFEIKWGQWHHRLS